MARHGRYLQVLVTLKVRRMTLQLTFADQGTNLQSRSESWLYDVSVSCQGHASLHMKLKWPVSPVQAVDHQFPHQYTLHGLTHAKWDRSLEAVNRSLPGEALTAV